MRVTSNQDLLNLDNILSCLEIKAINKGQSSLSIVSSTSPFSSSFLPFLPISTIRLVLTVLARRPSLSTLLRFTCPAFSSLLFSPFPGLFGKIGTSKSERDVVTRMLFLLGSGCFGESHFKDSEESFLSDSEEAFFFGLPNVNNLFFSNVNYHV